VTTVLLPITLTGRQHLVPEGMLRQSYCFRNKTISRLQLRFSIKGGYPGSNMIDVPQE
jgi:hypothetical protein